MHDKDREPHESSDIFAQLTAAFCVRTKDDQPRSHAYYVYVKELMHMYGTGHVQGSAICAQATPCCQFADMPDK